MKPDTFAAEAALAALKPFQRRTADYAFQRLYTDPVPTRQFLVADEVGLGKTLVARGVIAKAIEHLWDKSRRIDVVYICSNQAIAAQNINRLNVLGREAVALPTRMTMVPFQLRGERALEKHRVNFISLTPGTSFDSGNATGAVQERAFLLKLLEPIAPRYRGLYNLLEGNAHQKWPSVAEELSIAEIDAMLVEKFRSAVQADHSLMIGLATMCDAFGRRRDAYPDDMRGARNALIGRLRNLLAHICVEALEPDLIILDEFQRFRGLLHGDDEAAHLARDLFTYADAHGNSARTLLLSATPYRMLSLAGDDPAEGDHYQEFFETLEFLFGHDEGKARAGELACEMRSFRHYLQGFPATHAMAFDAKARIEGTLRSVIARTERVSSTAERNSMLSEVVTTAALDPDDLRHAAHIAAIARLLDAPEIVEYWKSSPYLLNFMRHYKLKELLKENCKSPPSALVKALENARPLMLSRNAIDRYQPINPGNGRMRALLDDVLGNGLAERLWMPPSLPYYGADFGAAHPTKALVFSSWSMAPDAIAAIASYESERRMGVAEDGKRYFDQQASRPLQFRMDQGRPAGLRNLLLVYPSPTLAKLADPLAIYCAAQDRPSYDMVRREVARLLSPALAAVRSPSILSAEDALEEWAGPALLDAAMSPRISEWLTSSDGFAARGDEEGLKDHVAELAKAANRSYGVQPDELTDLMTDVALGSPAVCALRALRRIVPELDWDDPVLLNAAAVVAWGFRTLFNQPDVVAFLRRGGEDRYWRRVLAYGAENDLQSVLDEYAHQLTSSLGLIGHGPNERAKGVAEAMSNAMSIRPSQIDIDDPQIEKDEITMKTFQMRGRFAMRLAEYKDDEGGVTRLGGVRDAFNSPFRPFVLATTSIGQEGLDFHPYCYRVYHWNLPSNPVDLEQREGRVHRFKNHAVRLNIAERYKRALQGLSRVPEDAWGLMFEMARADADGGPGLIPYWIFEGPYKVERRVPMLPFSKEVDRLQRLKRSLVVYRLAFGQPRQDDLLEYFAAFNIDISTLADLQICLQPKQVDDSSDASMQPPTLDHTGR